MGNTRGDKEYLGVDTNVLVAFLDKDHPDNPKTKMLVMYQYQAVNKDLLDVGEVVIDKKRLEIALP